MMREIIRLATSKPKVSRSKEQNTKKKRGGGEKKEAEKREIR